MNSRTLTSKQLCNETTLYKFISFLLLFTLGIESLNLPLQAHILPLTSFLAIAFAPLIITYIPITPLFKVLTWFLLFILLHSLVALFTDVVLLNEGATRFYAWFRQVAALALGVSVFIVLRKVLTRVSKRFIIFSVLLGAFYPLLVSYVIQVLHGRGLLGFLITKVRPFLTKSRVHQRASGLSLEPSHFAFYLVIIVIPMVLSLFVVLKRKGWFFIALICLSGPFLWTESTTGLIVLLSLILAGVFLGPKRKLFATSLAIILISVLVFLALNPGSYMTYQIRSLITGNWTLSIVTRFFSTFGPFTESLSSYTLLGYGLGGTSSHFGEIVPTVAQKPILSVKWKEMPNLNSLIGRIMAESGLIGLLLFAFLLWAGLQQIKHLIRREADQTKIVWLKIARITLVAVFMGSAIDYGSFALPYLWFWLAVIDASYVAALR